MRLAPERTEADANATERRRVEAELLRRNHELAILNELSGSINQAVELDDILRVGCRRICDLLSFEAAGVTLYTPDRRFLRLRLADGLEGELSSAIAQLSASDETLLAHAVRSGEVQVVEDLRRDARIRLAAVREAPFAGCTIVPLRARDRIHGGAFFFTREGTVLSAADRMLLVSMGTMLGTAIEKAALLANERAALHRMKALDDLAVTIATQHDLVGICEAVARSIHALFGPEQVMVARYIRVEDVFIPLGAVGVSEERRYPLARDETLMGQALDSQRPIQRLSRVSRHARVQDPDEGLPSWEQRAFAEGYLVAVALPVVLRGESVAALHIAYRKDQPLYEGDLDALLSIAKHLAVGIKNAELFRAREDALEELRATQDSLVQAERLHALGELAAGVAHDFNNLLGAILGRAQLLVRHLERDDLRKHAEVIETAAVDGAATVRRIQELGRKGDGEDLVAVSVNAILDDVRELTMPRWFQRTREERRPVEFAVEACDPADACVRGNPHELREVLINLVHNAVDAMPSGGRLTLAAALVRRHDQDHCQISVTDTGTGMSEEVKARIFESFFSTKGERGTGLGLSVSHSIVARHGGELQVHSRTAGADRGSTFVVTLPMAPAALSPDAQPPAVLSSGGSPAAPASAPDERPAGVARVLVIDDEENIRDILTDILLSGDHEVVAVCDGPAGLALLERESFDVIFTDLGLPGMSGYEVAAAAQRIRPQVPVGLVTGWGATLDDEEARSRGISMVISKPFRFDQVLGWVTQELARAGRLAHPRVGG